MLRIGFAEPAGFSERASCPRGKRRTSMCGALQVLSARSAAAEGPRRSGPTAKAIAKATATGGDRSSLRPGACSLLLTAEHVRCRLERPRRVAQVATRRLDVEHQVFMHARQRGVAEVARDAG